MRRGSLPRRDVEWARAPNGGAGFPGPCSPRRRISSAALFPRARANKRFWRVIARSRLGFNTGCRCCAVEIEEWAALLDAQPPPDATAALGVMTKACPSSVTRTPPLGSDPTTQT